MSGSLSVRRGRLLALAMSLSLFASACAGTTPSAPSGGGSAPAGSVLVIGVFHVDTGNGYSSIIANGITAAERDLQSYGVKTEFHGPDKFDLVAMGQLIDQAIAKNPAGLFISMPDASAIGPKIKAAADKGIPVIVYNSGLTEFRDFGALAYVGVDELESGRAAGSRLVSLGAKNVICLNHEVGNASLDARCQGISEQLTAAGGKSEVVVVDERDPTVSESAITAALKRDPTIDAIGGGGYGSDTEILDKALAATGRTGDIIVSIFDPNPARLQGIKDGKIAFVLSQQQYFQGYLPVEFLTFYKTYGLIPGGVGSVHLTGPLMVDKSNVDQLTSGAGKTF